MKVNTPLLPSYQRFVNGVPMALFSRRAFRPREKHLIFLVILTFGALCFGTFFFLPDFRKGTDGAYSSVYEVYQKIQKAGPDLLIPAPPHDLGIQDGHDPARYHNGIHIGLERPANALSQDIRIIEDKQKLQAKIDEEYQQQKTLEKPEVIDDTRVRVVSSSVSTVQVDRHRVDIVPPAPADVLPMTVGGEDKNAIMRQRRETVKQMMQHSWKNYKSHAWGKNELKPISKVAHSSSIFGSATMGATIVDGLDTLYIMGLHKEFKEGRDWIAEYLNFNINTDVSLFEINIRFLGSLLACYALTGDTMFREKAKALGEKMMPAFETETGIPHSLINFQDKTSKNYIWANRCSILSEIGTLHLEFVYLSDITGDPKFRDAVMRVRHVLKNLEKPKGLYPNFINPRSGKWGQHHISLGGLGDSFYEYLLKAWLQSAKTDEEAREMYDEAMAAVVEHMVQKSHEGLLYLADLKFDRLEHKMGHLACFAGGMFSLGAKTQQSKVSEEHMNIAAGLTHTCHESYSRSATKLGPEVFRFIKGNEARSLKNDDKYYILRPETFESYFMMWRLTKDPKYREWGWEAVQALETYCRVPGGYSGIKDVYRLNATKDDVQQSYFLAETLKYLYLLFSDDNLIRLDDWVFNSEAHVLPIKGNPLYRQKAPSST